MFDVGRSAFSFPLNITRRFPLFLAFVLIAPIAEARIGETSYQFAKRYGAPKDTPGSQAMDRTSSLIQGAIHHTYEYQGWKIRAAFLSLTGPAVRIDFSKLPNGQDLPIRNSELEAIKTVNTPLGMTWQQIPSNNSDAPNGSASKPVQASFAGMLTDKIWQRADGATISLHDPRTVRLELPAARQFEAHRKLREARKAQPVVRGS